MNDQDWEKHWSEYKRDPLKHIDKPLEYSDVSWKIYLKRLIQLVEEERLKRILEVGVGSGIATRYLYKLGYEVKAIDISKKAVDILNNRINEKKENTIAKRLNLYELNENSE